MIAFQRILIFFRHKLSQEEDQNREDTLYYVAMRVSDGRYISLEGSETTDGYICKTGKKFEDRYI